MATSRALDLTTLSEAAQQKGVQLLSAADFTHPEWRRELAEKLIDDGSGLFQLKGAHPDAPRFVLGTEVSCVWRDPPVTGRGRRVHLLLFAPDFVAVDALIARFEPHGALASDGRPLLRLSVHDVAALVMDADERCEIIPAHVWTPWYGVYGSKSGFDSLEEAFGEHAGRIHAIETGLSSDPEMNWGVSELENRALVSFSDAHSAANVGREVTVFEMEPGYDGLMGAIAAQSIAETIEFFPENGKYHLDGHRSCGIRLTPSESAELDGKCPACGKSLTLGVLNRIESLSVNAELSRLDDDGLVRGPVSRPPFRRLVPLRDLVAAVEGVGKNTKTVGRAVDRLIESCGSELNVLINTASRELQTATTDEIATAIVSVRQGDLEIEPGYDGVYGVVSPITD
jgi:DNA helicase-2/ATP-dependent DNA helicase PcrA